MTTGNGFKVVLRMALGVLVVSLVTLGLFSAASADRSVAAVASVTAREPVAPPAAPAVSRLAANDLQQCGNEAAPALAALTLSLDAASPSLTCATGFSPTCCSCGCGCRRNTVPALAFCKFIWCPTGAAPAPTAVPPTA